MKDVRIGGGVIPSALFKKPLGKFLTTLPEAYLKALLPNKTVDERNEILTDLYNKVNKDEPKEQNKPSRKAKDESDTILN